MPHGSANRRWDRATFMLIMSSLPHTGITGCNSVHVHVFIFPNTDLFSKSNIHVSMFGTEPTRRILVSLGMKGKNLECFPIRVHRRGWGRWGAFPWGVAMLNAVPSIVKLLSSAQAMILGSWEGAPCWGLSVQQGVSLSLSLCTSPPVRVCSPK